MKLVYMLLVTSFIGCDGGSEELEIPIDTERVAANVIEGNLVDIKYLNGQYFRIILIFEDGREIILIHSTNGSWTYPLKRGYVKIKHSSGYVKAVYEKNKKDEWIEIR